MDCIDFEAPLNIVGPTKKLFDSICRREKAPIILTLILEGADINAKTSNGFSPLLLSCKYELKTVVNLLIDSGAIVDNSECPHKRTLLHYASGYGWTDIVQSLVKRVPSQPSIVDSECSVLCEESTFFAIHAKDIGGRTPLHLASLRGHLEVVKCLLEKGVDIAVSNKCGETPLHDASSGGYLEVVKFLLAKGANIDARNKHGKSALHKASVKGYLKVVKFLLDKGANIDAMNEYGETALHDASSRGHLDVVKYLLDKGADMEAKSYKHFTPLLIAAQCYFHDIVVLLINSGAIVDCCDDYERTVLHYASQYGWISMVEYLVKKVPIPPFTLDRGNIVSSEKSICLTIHTRDMDGRTALHAASYCGHLAIVKFLAGKGADLDVRSKDGETALHEASARGKLKVVKFLVEEGANMNVRSSNGVTPLLDAARSAREDVVDLLVKSGANLDAYDENKCTVLHYASESGWTQIVQYLVKRVSNLDAKNNDGETALFSACSYGQLNSAECLLKAGARLDIRNKKGCLPFDFTRRFHCSFKITKLFVEFGAYLTPVDYYAIENSYMQKIHLLQDAKFCCQAIINRFNSCDLPALYKLPISANLPGIDKMVIASSSKVAQTIEGTVKHEIQTNGHCNIFKVRPMVLCVLSVRSVLEYYDKQKSVLGMKLKRLAASDSENENQHSCKSMRLN